MRLVMLPGMGCDCRLFEPQRSLPFELDLYDWIPPRRGETLAQYGSRMAETIDVKEPYCIVGVSMGGMIGLEMTKWLRPRRVILIGSARSGRAVRASLRFLRPLIRFIPEGCFRAASPLIGFSFRFDRNLTKVQRQWLTEMASQANPAFVRWACGAIVDWDLESDVPVPVGHIHGRCDHLLPVTGVHADVCIPGANHFINVSHAEEVNRFIIEQVALCG